MTHTTHTKTPVNMGRNSIDYISSLTFIFSVLKQIEVKCVKRKKKIHIHSFLYWCRVGVGCFPSAQLRSAENTWASRQDFNRMSRAQFLPSYLLLCALRSPETWAVRERPLQSEAHRNGRRPDLLLAGLMGTHVMSTRLPSTTVAGFLSPRMGA